MSLAVLDVDDFERTRVAFSVGNDTNTSLVSTTSDHGDVSDFELKVSGDLSGLDVEFDRVSELDSRGWVANSASIVGDNVRNGSGSGLSGLSSQDRVAASGGLGTLGNLSHLKELESGFGVGDSVESESSLDIVQKTEVLVGFWDGDDILETGWVVKVSSDFVVNLDEASHDDHHGFLTSQSVLKTVSQDKSEWKTLTELVRTGGRARSPDTAHFVKHPMLGGI